MAWYGLVRPATGDLASVGTEAMFPDGDLNAFVGVYDVVSFGETPPNWAVKIWIAATRSLLDRPPPVLISRLDDIEAWLIADPDFALAWNSLNATRKTQVRTGLRRVMAKILGGQEWRQENDTVEL
jgi:hypothetical protein